MHQLRTRNCNAITIIWSAHFLRGNQVFKNTTKSIFAIEIARRFSNQHLHNVASSTVSNLVGGSGAPKDELSEKNRYVIVTKLVMLRDLEKLVKFRSVEKADALFAEVTILLVPTNTQDGQGGVNKS